MQWTTRAWDGVEPIQDKTLLAIANGGFGDCLQMIRYMPRLAAIAGSLIIAVRPQILSLVEHNFGRIATVVSTERLPLIPFQRYVWMMSLPALIGSIPAFDALRTPSATPAAPREGRLRVGLNWAGTSHHPNDRDDNLRSITLDDLSPLLELEWVTWYSVQVGRWASDADHNARIVQPSTPIRSFEDSANLVAALDCVVTIDTAVAHLAGSLNVPTLVLLTWLPEFRWGLVSERTPWYPSLLLIRQTSPGDWPGVFDRTFQHLRALYTGAAASA